ncbi:hypothetical protein Mame01_26130 [Microbispora amethystogenes]|nr:hypothetical protein Mame01_26130 [Microbispora amethystogenes]
MNLDIFGTFTSLAAQIVITSRWSGFRQVSAALELKDLGGLLAQAVRLAEDARHDASVDMMAAATERIFDALLVMDRAIETRMQDGLAMAEDICWYADWSQLNHLTPRTLGDVLGRTRSRAREVAELCADSDIRQRFLYALHN